MPGRPDDWFAILPVPAGFVINTVFYATVLVAVMALLPSARRRRRLKRGLCPRCAYPLATGAGGAGMLMCSECGWGVSSRA